MQAYKRKQNAMIKIAMLRKKISSLEHFEVLNKTEWIAMGILLEF